MSNLEGILSNSFRNINVQGINKNIKYVKKNQTIQSVVDSIQDESATNPYTVIVPPGTYKEKVVLADYISIQGMGRKSTIITGDSSSRGIQPGNGCLISNLGIDGVTYEGEGKSCAWSIGLPDTTGNITFYVDNCYFYTKSSSIHVETDGNENRCYVYNCITDTNFDGFVALDNAKIFAYDCYFNILYHASHVRKMFVVGHNGAELYANNCHVYMSIGDIGTHVYGAEAYAITSPESGLLVLNNCYFDLTATSGSGVMYGCRAIGDDETVIIYGGRINLSHTGTVKSASATYNGTVEMYNVDINQHLVGSLAEPGILKGVPLHKVNRGTMSDNETFEADDGTVFIRDPGGAARNFNPTNTYFLDGTIITLINIADAAETITFDSAGLNQAVAQNERGIFAYHKTDGWLKVFVG